MGVRSKFSLTVVLGAVLTTAISGFALAPLWRAFLIRPDTIHTTILGDQAFYMWAIERARHATTFSSFIVDCDLSTTRCFDLRSAPYEWPSLYVHGRLASLLGLDSNVLMSIVYYTSPVLNGLAAFAFVGVVSRQWLLAGAFAPLVGFQLSPLFRLRGHLCLVYLWPLVLSLALWWLVLHSISRREARIRSLLLCSVGFSSSWVLLSVCSYYYFAFSLPLLLVLTVAFFACGLHEPSFRQTALPIRLAAALGPPLLACAVAVAINAHAMLGYAGGGFAMERSIHDVFRYSAEFRDYFAPYGTPSPSAGEGPFEAAPASPLFRAMGLVQSNRALADRGEVFAFLGGTTLALLLTTAVFAATRIARRCVDFDVRRCVALGAASAVTLFLGTGTGGRYVHAVVPALRCFNRLAPIAVLLLVALVAVVWARYRRPAVAVAVAVAAASAVEFHGYAEPKGLLSPESLWDMQDFHTSATALGASCADGALRVDPPISNYMLGPYWKLAAGEVARCRLDDVGGPGIVPTPSPAPVAGVFHDDWSVSEP